MEAGSASGCSLTGGGAAAAFLRPPLAALCPGRVVGNYGGGEGALGRGLCGGGRGRPIGERPASRPAAFGGGRGGGGAPLAVNLSRSAGCAALGPPGASFVSPWAQGGKSPCDRVVVVAFPLPAPPSSGQAPLQRPPFLLVRAAREVRPGLRELCNAAAPLPGSQPGSPRRGGQRRPCRRLAARRAPGPRGERGGREEPLAPLRERS